MPEWCSIPNVDVLDFFAGRARISKLAKWMGLTAMAYDIGYHPVDPNKTRKRGRKRRSCMDWNGEAGFVPLRFMVNCGFGFLSICFPVFGLLSGIANQSETITLSSQVGNSNVSCWSVWGCTMHARCSLLILVSCQHPYQSKIHTYTLWGLLSNWSTGREQDGGQDSSKNNWEWIGMRFFFPSHYLVVLKDI